MAREVLLVDYTCKKSLIGGCFGVDLLTVKSGGNMGIKERKKEGDELKNVRENSIVLLLWEFLGDFFYRCDFKDIFEMKREVGEK